MINVWQKDILQSSHENENIAKSLFHTISPGMLFITLSSKFITWLQKSKAKERKLLLLFFFSFRGNHLKLLCFCRSNIVAFSYIKSYLWVWLWNKLFCRECVMLLPGNIKINGERLNLLKSNNLVWKWSSSCPLHFTADKCKRHSGGKKK